MQATATNTGASRTSRIAASATSATRLISISFHSTTIPGGDLRGRGDDVRDVLVGHPRVDRQRDLTAEGLQRMWEVARLEPVGGAVEGMEVQGDEMDAGPDVGRAKLPDELVARDRQPLGPQPEHVEVPGVLHVRRLRRRLQLRQVGERGRVAPGDLAPALEEPVAPRQLV